MRELIFILVIFVLSCTSSNKTGNAELTYTTRDDSELFFKNIRQSNYDLQEEKEARINIFRHRKRNRASLLNIAIAHNWIADQAFIMLEWSDSSLNSNDAVVYTYSNKEIIYQPGSVRQQTEFARDLYNLLQEGEQAFMINDRDTLFLYRLNEERDLFFTVMNDYFRLTGIE